MCSPELHVAAMPFPTRQGTQAVVHEMLRARLDADRDPHLLTYGEGEAAIATRYPRHHTPALIGTPSLRSGPSTRKLALDALLARRVATLVRRLRPRVIIAHHVEATMAALAARARPLIFFAHTDLAAELPTYLSPRLAPVLARAGRGLDAELCRRANAVATISPALRDVLSPLTDAPVAWVPPPWPLPDTTPADVRGTARREHGLKSDSRVILYAGNLDGYQGWPLLIAALAQLPDALLLVATASKDDPLRVAAGRAGVSDRVRVVGLPTDEKGRAALHAAADVAVVPRRAPGGLPIKLLEALSRGVPTVAVRRAAAGLPLDGAAILANDDDPAALAACLRLVLAGRRATEELSARGRSYVRRAHAPARFDAALEALSDEAGLQRVSRNATRSSISASLR